MPQVFFSTTGNNRFSFAADEAPHPILNAILNGNLDHFLLAVMHVSTVTIGTEVMPLARPGDLYLAGHDEVFGHGVSRNLAWLAAHCQHYHLLNYMFVNREALGLNLDRFIMVASMANRHNSPNQLRNFVELNPEIIGAYNQEMGPENHYLPMPQV